MNNLLINKPLRIAVVSTYPPGRGTLNEYGYHLIKHLRGSLDFRSVVLIADELPEGLHYEVEPEGQPLEIEVAWRFNGWTNPLRILRAIRRTKPDVVLFNMQFLLFGDKKIPAALGLVTPMMAKWAGFPSVVLLHNILEEVDLKKAGISANPILSYILETIGALLTRVILKADLVTVTIAKYVTVLRNRYKAKNVVLVPHGSFELPPSPDFSLPAGPKKVMTFGKFGTYKRVEVLIEAVEEVRRRTSLNIEVVIAGTDSPNKAGYLDEMKAKYAHVPQLTFTGYVLEEDVPRIFGESAVVVFPYTSTTGSSGVLHQAGSYAKAAILPYIGDLAQLIREEGYEGAFFEPDNVSSLADAIQRVLEDENYRTQLARKNYLASITLPMEDIVSWYHLHFERLLRGRSLR